ncbi:MAG: hypothetical protein V4638_07080 [Bacteroidota bacterium]
MKEIKNITVLLFGLLVYNLSFGQKVVEDVSPMLAPNYIFQKDDLLSDVNGKKLSCQKFFLSGNHFAGVLHHVGSKAGNTNCLYIQNFNNELMPIGEKKIIFDLKASGYSEESIKEAFTPEISLISSPDHNFSLISFIVQPFETGWEKESKGDNLAFVCVLDSASNVVAEYIYKTTIPSSQLQIKLLSQGNNGDAIFSAMELIADGVYAKKIVATQDVILNHNGQVLTLDPMKVHFGMVGELKASINDKGNLVYAISNSELNGKLVSISMRDVDMNKGELLSELSIDVPLDYNYKIAHVSRLKDGSKLVVFELGRAYMEWGLLICQFDNDGELTWKKNLYKVEYGGSFYDNNNDLSLLVNWDEKVFDGGKLPGNDQAWGSQNDKFTPVIITIGKTEENLGMKKLIIPGFTNIELEDISEGPKNGMFWFGEKKDALSYKLMGSLSYKLIDLNAK